MSSSFESSMKDVVYWRARLRLKKETKEKIEAEAKREFRKISDAVVYIIEQHFKEKTNG